MKKVKKINRRIVDAKANRIARHVYRRCKDSIVDSIKEKAARLLERGQKMLDSIAGRIRPEDDNGERKGILDAKKKIAGAIALLLTPQGRVAAGFAPAAAFTASALLIFRAITILGGIARALPVLIPIIAVLKAAHALLKKAGIISKQEA